MSRFVYHPEGAKQTGVVHMARHGRPIREMTDDTREKPVCVAYGRTLAPPRHDTAAARW
jgi:hypothetical protein